MRVIQELNRLGKYLRGRPLLVVLVLAALVILMKWTTQSYRRNGYVLTLEYTGQLVAGLRALLSQQCWISSFGLPLLIVEPFSNNSLLRHSHRMWKDYSRNSPTVRFRDLFDLDHFNEQSKVVGDAGIAEWEEFIEFAPRKVILLTINDIHRSGCLLFDADTCNSVEPTVNKKVFQGCNYSKNSRATLEYLKRHDFYVVRNVCLNCMEDMINLTPDAVTNYIFGSHDAWDVTLIVNRWRFSMRINKNCREMDTCRNQEGVLSQRFVRSRRLERDANWYLNSYFPSQMIITIMIRIEWHFITNRKETHNDAIKCLMEVLTTVEGLQKNFGNINIPSFLSMDVGSYGSGTFHQTIQHTNTSISTYDDVLNHTRVFVKKLYRGAWTFNDWEESFLTVPGLLMDRGYIATLQRTIAAKGDCLILMGGGHFQHMALQAYLSTHPSSNEQCVKYVCVAPPFKRLFKTAIH